MNTVPNADAKKDKLSVELLLNYDYEGVKK